MLKTVSRGSRERGRGREGGNSTQGGALLRLNQYDFKAFLPLAFLVFTEKVRHVTTCYITGITLLRTLSINMLVPSTASSECNPFSQINKNYWPYMVLKICVFIFVGSTKFSLFLAAQGRGVTVLRGDVLLSLNQY